jgi:DNA-binding MarR family transcriptional regulator
VSSTTTSRRSTRQPRASRDRPTGEQVVIELSARQVARVVRAAGDTNNSLSVLLAVLTNKRYEIAVKARDLDDRRLSRSLLVGLSMLLSFPSDGSYLGVAELADLLGMHTSTTHRYISTLAATGLVEQHPETRRYRLAT